MDKMDLYGNTSNDFPGSAPRVTPSMVRARTIELAQMAGRSDLEIRQHDYEQAKRELTGESDVERQHAVLYPVDAKRCS